VKLGEALAQVSDLRKEIPRLQSRIQAVARYQEGSEPPEDTVALMTAARAAVADMAGLVRRINRTNAGTEISPGRTITDAIAERDRLGLLRNVITSAADAAGPDRYDLLRRTRSELVTKTDMPVRDLRAEADRLARDRRLLDAQIQQADWATDLLD
jgi:uncharacterized protein DUF6847